MNCISITGCGSETDCVCEHSGRLPGTGFDVPGRRV